MVRKGLSWLLAVAPLALWADTLHLKDKAAITGKVLSEKRDQVAIDVGYTVLVIPRNQISRIEKQAAGIETSSPEAREDSAPTSSLLYTTAARKGEARNVRDLVAEVGEAVVQVRTPAGLGSGFFINKEGYLITNFHVIEGETQITIEVYHQRHGQLDRKNYKELRIIAMNKFEDLALLKVEDKDAPQFKFVPLGSTDSLAVGERVFAVGSPLGLERTVTEGILSTKTRQMQGELYLQTTTQINPGNSGGPLFNMLGDVVGVTNMKITFGEGLGFAIPVEAVRFFLDNRDAYAYSNNNPTSAFRYLAPPSRTRPVSAEDRSGIE